jgi:hypothetical protein
MDNALEFAACAVADIASQLEAELRRARARLEDAQRCFQEAADRADSAIPIATRREVVACQRRVAALEQVLAGLPGGKGGPHAASA